MEETTITMAEEEIIQAALTAAKLATKMSDVKLDVAYAGNFFTMTFRQSALKGEKFDREKSEIYATKSYDVNELPAALFLDCPAARHGLKQKMGDNLAMRKEDKETTAISAAISATDDLWKQLVNGDWNAVGKANNPNVIKVDTQVAKAGLAAMSDEDQAKAIELMKSLGIKF